jgi:RecB family endonuclease NucS
MIQSGRRCKDDVIGNYVPINNLLIDQLGARWWLSMIEKEVIKVSFSATALSHLKSLFDWDEESVITVGGEERLLLCKHDTLIEAPHAVRADVENVGVGEELQRVGIVDLVGALICR